MGLSADDERPAAVATRWVETPPLLFSLARWMIRNGVKGGWRLWNALRVRGGLDCVARYRLTGTLRETVMLAPLARPESSWSAREILEYDRDVVECVVRVLEDDPRPVFLVDCGADIGMVSAGLVRECPNLARVVAFEPNPEAYRYLKDAAADWPVPTTAINAALGARAMRGRLVSPATDPSAHACYVEADGEGDVHVRRIDDLDIPDDHILLLKIDVEGGERDVVSGARSRLGEAPKFVVVFEAHRDVAARTGVDPCEIIRLLEAIAPVSASVVEAPGGAIDRSAPFFPQIEGTGLKVCNVLCVSRAR